MMPQQPISRPVIISSGWMLSANGGMMIHESRFQIENWTRAWDPEQDFQMTWYDMCLRVK